MSPVLRTKADATNAFIGFETKLFNKIGKHISIERSDNGKKYLNTTMSKYCSRFGITHQTSTAYTPQQNGRAERPNRSVIEGMSSMLHDSKLPWNYWGFAAHTFVYLKNRSPHSGLPRSTLYEQWFGHLPDCLWFILLRTYSFTKTLWCWFKTITKIHRNDICWIFSHPKRL